MRLRVNSVEPVAGGVVLSLSDGTDVIINCNAKEKLIIFSELVPDDAVPGVRKAQYEWIDVQPEGLFHDGKLFAKVYGLMSYTFVRAPVGFRSKRDE